MALPINIESLVHGETVEWERLEFKQGWNPEDVIHTMCAFANDLHNWGGGYIVIGVAEQNGQPILPPAGLQQNQLDSIQGEIVQLGYKILPNYFPITQPYLLKDQHVLVLWCPAGDNRPYSAPVTLGNGSPRQYYIRIGSRSLIAQAEQIRQLQELAARVPFDDRINNQSSIQDFDLGLIQSYLQEIKSDLYSESLYMPLASLCRAMYIAKGPAEDLRPVNVGLLFFTKKPEHYFQRAQIELVWHQDMTGQNFLEHYFKGPLHFQLRDALSFLQTNVINEYIRKYPGKAEAVRYFNFPFGAIEEVLSNAVYHKSYELPSPIEIQVWPDKILVLSFPGPVPPVNAEILRTQRIIVAREYRNRRIGDFLKELHLTEGRGTGFPTIYNSMAANGSPEPIFETDDQSTYFLATLPIHPYTTIQDYNQDNRLYFNTLEDLISFGDQDTNQDTNQDTRSWIHHPPDRAVIQAKNIISQQINERVPEILEILRRWRKGSELFTELGLTNQPYNRKRYLDPLISIRWVEREFPDKPTSKKQRYRLSDSGLTILELIT